MYRPVTGLWGFPITCPIHSFIKACKFWRETSQMVTHTSCSMHTCGAICRHEQREGENEQFYQEVVLWQCWYKARFDRLKKVKPLSRPPVGETWQSVSVFQNVLLLLISFPPVCVLTEWNVRVYLRKSVPESSQLRVDLGKFSEQLWARQRLKCLLEWGGTLDPIALYDALFSKDVIRCSKKKCFLIMATEWKSMQLPNHRMVSIKTRHNYKNYFMKCLCCWGNCKPFKIAYIE